MSERGDDKAERIVGEALASGPADILGLLRALRRTMPGPLARAEGAVHALVHRMVKRGDVVPDGRTAQGLTRYRAAAGEAEAAPADAPGPGPLPEGLAKRALKVAGAEKDPAHRGRILGDVLAHLQELDEAGHLARFGSTRAARALVERVARGRSTVVLTASGADFGRRLLLHEGPWVLCAVLVFLVLKVFVVSPFKIPSDSMVPTLVRGDRVAVFTLFRKDVPDRWDVVVFERGETHYVKRLVGLPGESIALWYGDVYIDGTMIRKPYALREALRTNVGRWPLSSAEQDGWRVKEVDGGRLWTWAAATFEAFPSSYGEFPMHDGYARLEGDRGRGTVELALLRGPGPMGDDAVRWTLVANEGAVILRRRAMAGPDPVGPVEELARGPGVAAGAPLEISFVDGVLRASAGAWSAEVPRPQAPVAPLGVTLLVHGGSDRGLTLSVDRDHHYAHGHGTSHGTPTPSAKGPTDFQHEIAPDRAYFLGDNTTNSQDSRFRAVGDIPVKDLVGSVSVRIWPPGRWGVVR